MSEDQLGTGGQPRRFTSAWVESTGIWVFTERELESCTCRFTEAMAMAPRTSEIESGFRNIAVGANRLAKHGLPEGEFSQR